MIGNDHWDLKIDGNVKMIGLQMALGWGSLREIENSLGIEKN